MLPPLSKGTVYQGIRRSHCQPLVLRNNRVFTPTRALSVSTLTVKDFDWGSGEPGAALLAFAILLEEAGGGDAIQHYQRFRFAIVADLPLERFTLTGEQIAAWLKEHRKDALTISEK